MAEVKPGKGKYRVVAGCAVVRTLDGSDRYVYKNTSIDASQADAANIEHLVSSGLIVAVRAAGPTAAEKVEADAKAAAEKVAADAKAEADKAAADTKAEAEKAEAAKVAKADEAKAK